MKAQRPVGAVAAGAVAAVLAGLNNPVALADEPEDGPRCTDDRVPVALAPGQPAVQEVAVRLCLPSGEPPHLVQLLVAGATYNRTYWEFPVEESSYVDNMTEHGYATMTFERLNSGASDSVNPLLITVQVDAYTIHQVVTAIREKGVAGHRFGKVVTVGHSMGSINITEEAGLFQDVDGVLVTGFTHYPAPDLATGIATNQIIDPAEEQPGEITTKPGARREYFYGSAGANPGVIEADEANRDTITLAEFATFPTNVAGVQSNLITAPVMLAEGADERVFHCGIGPCDSVGKLRQVEGIRYTGASSVELFVLAGSGHNLNLASNGPAFFAAARDWLDRTIS